MGGLGMLTGQDADDKLRRDRQRAREGMLGNQPGGGIDPVEGGFGAKLRADQSNLDLFRKQFGGILGNINAYGRSAKQDAFDALQTNLGDASQRAISTGRYSTSFLDSSRQQAAGMYSRSINDINSSLASTYSNVALAGLDTEIGLNTAVGYNMYDRARFNAENWWPSGTAYQPQTGGIMNLLETAASGAATAGAFAALSDRRLKRNIKSAGRRGRHNWYTWDWVWGGSSEGVMADEVERYMPEAVIEVGGYKAVKYGAL